MYDNQLIINLVLILGLAAIGGTLALRLKQPTIIGYLVAGLALGPFTPGPIADFDQLRFLTEIGLALLLFVLGTRMSPVRFRGLGKVIIFGGLAQIILTIGLGLLFVPLLNFSLLQGFLLGTILAQSSSAVIAKVLDDRDEVGSVHGRIAVGVSLIQDITSLPLLLVLLVFMGGDNGDFFSLVIALGEVFGLAAATYLLGRIVWPRALEWFSRMGSDELIILVGVALALGSGLIMEYIGLSFALGAFLAGLMIAESPRQPAVISRILPLRDVFAALFFVSIGSLFDPSVIWESAIPLLGILALLIFGKALIGSLVTRGFGHTSADSILSGLLLAQIGEFAFILVNIGLDKGVISQTLFSLIIAAAVISIFVNSFILDSAPPVLRSIARITRFRPLIKLR